MYLHVYTHTHKATLDEPKIFHTCILTVTQAKQTYQTISCNSIESLMIKIYRVSTNALCKLHSANYKNTQPYAQ